MPVQRTPTVGRLKRAQLTASIGAGVLGAGIALLLPAFIQVYALPIVALGLVMHAWGMYDKHRIENDAGTPRVWWSELLYWLCWITLAALLLYVLVKGA